MPLGSVKTLGITQNHFVYVLYNCTWFEVVIIVICQKSSMLTFEFNVDLCVTFSIFLARPTSDCLVNAILLRDCIHHVTLQQCSPHQNHGQVLHWLFSDLLEL